MTATGTPQINRYQLNTEFYNNGVIHRRNTGKQEHWTQVKKLGQGGQGFVYLQQEVTTAELRAVKKLLVEDLQRNGLDVGRELCHFMALMDRRDLFVEFRGWYKDETGILLYLVMEYFEQGDLGQLIKEFGPQGEENAKEITRQLLEGLVVLHQRQICHRDLKPQNILIASKSPIRVKIADFGISKSTAGTSLRTRCGTHGYLAPELQGFRPRGYLSENEYTNAVDIWALGCVVHEILTSQIPFLEIVSDTTLPWTSFSRLETQFDMDSFSEFCKGRISLPIELLQQSQVSGRGVDFTKRLLIANPSFRPSAAEALNDIWL